MQNKIFFKEEIACIKILLFAENYRHSLMVPNRLLKEIILYRITNYSLWKRRVGALNA
jgi:hypothetical protein